MNSSRFSLIFAGFYTLSHLYSLGDLRSFLAHAFRHLLPGGEFTFDLPLPRIDVPGYDPIAQVRVTTMGTEDAPQLLTQRWYFPQEMKMHLEEAGFRRIRILGDFGTAPPHRLTDTLCFIASRPKERPC